MSKSKSPSKAGGFRPGSGRKPLPDSERKVLIQVFVKPDVKTKLESLANNLTLSLGDYIELILPD